MTGATPSARRARRQAPEQQGVAQQSVETSPPDPVLAGPPAPRAKPRRPRPARDAGDGGLRDLVGSGSSQLGLSGALRGRDVNRPTEQDLAVAERETVVVRRNWKPPAQT
jgi:hypothetical protein